MFYEPRSSAFLSKVQRKVCPHRARVHGKDAQNTKVYILMSLGLHHIKLTLKREKCHFRNEHRLTVKYPLAKNKTSPPHRKGVLKRPHTPKTVQKKGKESNTGWIIWQRLPLFIQAMFLAPSLVRNRSLSSPHYTFQWPFWCLMRDENR